jgi:hypothetical protein
MSLHIHTIERVGYSNWLVTGINTETDNPEDFQFRWFVTESSLCDERYVVDVCAPGDVDTRVRTLNNIRFVHGRR